MRNNHSKRWLWFDYEYIDKYAKHLGVYCTAVYASLCRHIDNKTQSCFPSMRLIAEQNNISTRTVERSIKTLEDWGIIKIKKRRKKDGTNANNEYTLTKTSSWKKAPHDCGTTGIHPTLTTYPPDSDDINHPTVVLHNKTHITTSTETSSVRSDRIKTMYNYELVDENGNPIGEKKKRIKITKQENDLLISVGYLWRDMAKKALQLEEKDIVMKNIYYPIRELYNREKWQRKDFEELFKYFFKDPKIPYSTKLAFDLCMSQKYVSQFKLAQKSKAKTNASLSGDIKL